MHDTVNAAERKPPELPPPLELLSGIWDSYADGYIISSSALEYHFEGQGLNFSGDIRHIVPYGDDRGVIIIEYTEAPEKPYATGTLNYLGIYYRIINRDSVKFANSYDTTGTDTLDLAQALEKFSPENEADFVLDWDGTYMLFRQSAPVCDMGALRGAWEGDDDFPSWLSISDYRLTLCMVGVSPLTVAYSGTIVRATPPDAEEGYIYICLSTGDTAVFSEDRSGSYYALHWRRGGQKTWFSVYNDRGAALSENLESLTGLRAGNGDFGSFGLKSGGDPAADGYVGFVKR